MTGLHPEIYIEPFRTLPALHQADEEGSLVYLGQCLPRSVRENQTIPHAPTYPRSSSVRETLLDVRSGNGLFSRSLTSLE